MPNHIDILCETLQASMKRIREVHIPAYLEIGPAGTLAIVIMMKISLARAKKAIADNNVIAMVERIEDLDGYSL